VAFAAHVERAGLVALCPTTYRAPADVRFPCIVKPAMAAYETGMRILRSRGELESFLAQEGWDCSRWIFQEFVEGEIEYATHCVFERGRLLWSCSFAFERLPGTDIRQGIAFRTLRPFTPTEAVLDAITRLLSPLDYSGPCTVDYKLRDADRIAIFEINPRFGGSLILPMNRHHFQAALRCIIDRSTA
jgi:carbamoylphosphate synthase large subunit